ncbi:MAG TPA: NBR1-Ig-like domain-containing protein [Anaerolineae bacterium]|nr:NBR1-Ig-like domain-containing protein [Anaerolineae bacterium]
MRSALIFPFIFVVLGFVIIACQPIATQQSKPTVIIASPPSGSLYTAGEEVVVQSTSTDPLGVTRVALIVDGNTVREDPSPVAQGQAQFSVLQSWVATTAGQHTITVRATNSQGATADSGIIINVKEQTGLQPTAIIAIATAVPLASLPPLPTAASTNAPSTPNGVVTPTLVPPAETATATLPPPCVDNSKFVTDVTIPDGTIFTPGAVFTKTWRVQNNGNCAWTNFSLVFVSGTQMAAGGIFPVPNTPPGGTADLTVPMTAPANYGPYQGTWRIRNAAGQLFGTPLTVIINVPSPATPVPPTHTPPPTIAGCSGQPNEFTFSASSPSINAGQSVTLSWSAITNASAAFLDGGEFSNQGVETPGNRTVSPNSTTNYTLTAVCNNSGQTRQHSVTINVNANVGNFAGHWEHNFGWMDLTQNGAQVTGTYHNSADGGNGTIAGIVTGNTLNGTYQKINSNSIQFVLGNNGNTFNGNWGGSNQWCGARTGVSFPSNCAYDGNWTTHYINPDNPNCQMALSQVGTHVTGTYCLGTVAGDITYSGGALVLTGTWQHTADALNGSLTFYLPVYTYKQFQGNYNGTLDWCGHRGGAPEPSPCKK